MSPNRQGGERMCAAIIVGPCSPLAVAHLRSLLKRWHIQATTEERWLNESRTKREEKPLVVLDEDSLAIPLPVCVGRIMSVHPGARVLLVGRPAHQTPCRDSSALASMASCRILASSGR